MKKKDVKIGGLYTAKVSDRLVTVRIDSTNTHGGWNATNTATGKRIRVKSAQRLRGPATQDNGKRQKGTKMNPANKELDSRMAGYDADNEVKPAVNPTVEIVTGQPLPKEAKPKKQRSEKKADDKPKKMSALDAAAEVLKDTKGPLNAKELIETMAARGLWSSPNGKTPEATLYAAMMREINSKGADARFLKVDRGQFAHAG